MPLFSAISDNHGPLHLNVPWILQFSAQQQKSVAPTLKVLHDKNYKKPFLLVKTLCSFHGNNQYGGDF